MDCNTLLSMRGSGQSLPSIVYRYLQSYRAGWFCIKDTFFFALLFFLYLFCASATPQRPTCSCNANPAGSPIRDWHAPAGWGMPDSIQGRQNDSQVRYHWATTPPIVPPHPWFHFETEQSKTKTVLHKLRNFERNHWKLCFAYFALFLFQFLASFHILLTPFASNFAYFCFIPKTNSQDSSSTSSIAIRKFGIIVFSNSTTFSHICDTKLQFVNVG